MAITRRHFLQGLAGTAVAVLAACSATPAASPGPGTASSPPPSSAAASPAAKAASTSGAASASGSSEWEAIVAAGKREGKVTMFGPVGNEVREVLVDAFQKQYGIAVELTSVPGNTIGQKVILERNAGQYNWDVLIAGTTNSLTTLVPIKALD